MSNKVIRVSSAKELRDFIDLPFLIYKDSTLWVAPIKSELRRVLDGKKNPYFRSASLDMFNCYSEGKIAARIVISVNRDFNSKSASTTGFFGFFEAFNDPDAVKHLFSEVRGFCMKKGIDRLEGPFNPNLYSELGMLNGNYDSPPTFFQTFNPQYYHSLLKDNGFTVLETLHTRINRDASGYLNARYGKGNALRSGDLTLRDFDHKNKERDLEHMRNIYNDAFSGNWHFTSVSREEYLFVSKNLKLVTPPDHIKFVEYRGEPVGVVHFALDLNPLLRKFKGRKNVFRYMELLGKRKSIDRAIIFAVGIKKDFRNSRVTALLFRATADIGKRYKILESTWMYDGNKVAVSVAEKLGLMKEKEYLIYSCDLP